MKREDYISWDEYFMGVAKLAGMRSKDPGTQVGACIVGQDNKILSMGYNGFPIGCSDDEFPWERDSLQAGWRRRITNMHSTWELRREVQVHFLKILQQSKK